MPQRKHSDDRQRTARQMIALVGIAVVLAAGMILSSEPAAGPMFQDVTAERPISHQEFEASSMVASASAESATEPPRDSGERGRDLALERERPTR